MLIMGSSRVFNNSSLARTLVFFLLLLCTFHPAHFNVIFERVPMLGTYLQLGDTRHNVASSGECALHCSYGGISPTCRAFDYQGGTCTLYSSGSSLVTVQGLHVFLIQRQLDVFHTIYIGGQTFSYLLPSVMHPYLDARAYCNQLGAHLLEFDSLDEYDAVLSFVGMDPNAYYIGAHDIGHEGVWVNDKDNSPINTAIFKWELGQPNGGSSQNCVVYASHLKYVNDAGCPTFRNFLCERPLP